MIKVGTLSKGRSKLFSGMLLLCCEPILKKKKTLLAKKKLHLNSLLDPPLVFFGERESFPFLFFLGTCKNEAIKEDWEEKPNALWFRTEKNAAKIAI